MINATLRVFIDRVLENNRITAENVQQLQRAVLRDGVTTREEADVLVALDRAIAEADPFWADFLVASIVDFVVWTSRPTGFVSHDDAIWLATTLSCGGGPTEHAKRIAFEVIREAEQVDEALLAFAMRGSRRRSREAGTQRELRVLPA
jgi:hypothetical protein